MSGLAAAGLPPASDRASGPGTEKRSRTPAPGSVGRSVRASSGHHSVRASTRSLPSSAPAMRVRRSNVLRDAGPTQVCASSRSPARAGAR